MLPKENENSENETEFIRDEIESRDCAESQPEVTMPELNHKDMSWMDQCLFKCRKCVAILSSKAEFTGQHGIASLKKYSKLFGNPCHQLKLATCIPCNSVIMCEREALSLHIEIVHNKIRPENIQSLFDF